ncbi:hypothetical protein RF11_03175 [Thelohanellus kitauei]|uniref:Hyaluronan/mRNA-binding protein domain-containing protein n=1 Tax=Thelohanellus kitauei TaxID=669202 RepID=A0A0C2INH7_THEKT|nr:hypothetical protein RF11_03175 [Thelohanellus kitauei]
MAAVGNRFESLLINAQNPLEKSKKKPKKRSEGKAQGQTKKPQSQTQAKKSVQTQPQAPPSPILSKTEPEPVPVKPGFLQTTKVIISDITPTQIKSSMLSKKPTNVVVKDVTPTKVEEKSGALNDSTFDLDFKSRATGRYQKMMVSRGRVFERHGPSRSYRQPEKRHGHGAYNWGEQLENTATSIDVDESVVEQQTPGEGKEECVPVTFTLGQYKKLVEEKKVDPLSWSDPSQQSTTVVADKGDAREYEYHRGYDTPRGRGGRRFQGRGPSRSRGGPTTPRNQTNNVHEVRERGVVYDVKVDDIKDFPDL